MEKKNLALVTEITNNNADSLIGICEKAKVYTLTFNLEGVCTLDIQVLDDDTSKLLQKVNPHSGFITGSYAYRFFCPHAGNLKFDIKGTFGKIDNIVLVEG